MIPTEQSRTLSGGLGFSAPSYNSLFVRDYWTLFAVAVEGCISLDELILEQRSDIWARFDREQLVDAAFALAAEVERLSLPVRDVVLLRASGMGWARMVRARPSRVYFSMVEDWQASVRTLTARCAGPIDLLQGERR